MSNSAEEFAKIWSMKLEKLRRVLRRLPRDVGNEALLWFMNNFKKAQDPDGRPWKPRKDGDGTRALLVKSGRLRKSIRVTRADATAVRIGTNVPYAKFHNDGTTKIPQRKFLGPSAILNRRLVRYIKAKVLWALR